MEVKGDIETVEACGDRACIGELQEDVGNDGRRDCMGFLLDMVKGVA